MISVALMPDHLQKHAGFVSMVSREQELSYMEIIDEEEQTQDGPRDS
jgi:hypothetical protein